MKNITIPDERCELINKLKNINLTLDFSDIKYIPPQSKLIVSQQNTPQNDITISISYDDVDQEIIDKLDLKNTALPRVCDEETKLKTIDQDRFVVIYTFANENEHFHLTILVISRQSISEFYFILSHSHEALDSVHSNSTNKLKNLNIHHQGTGGGGRD